MATTSSSGERAALSVDEFPGLQQTAATLAYWLREMFEEMSESDQAYVAVDNVLEECRLYKQETSDKLKNRWKTLQESAWLIQLQGSAHAEAARLASESCSLVLNTLSPGKRDRLITRQFHHHFLHYIGGG